MLGITNFKTVYVPGAWELVHATQKELAHADGVIAYGVVIRGETNHYELISASIPICIKPCALAQERALVMKALSCRMTPRTSMGGI